MKTPIIIGAGPAGLAAAGALRQRGSDALVLEQFSNVGHRWRTHYDRLHLHTPKSMSALPGKGFDRSVSRYPSRERVVEFFETYADQFNITPQFNTTVNNVLRDGDQWLVETDQGNFTSPYLIMATGYNNVPVMVEKPGLNSFEGQIIHSSTYKNGETYKGRNVLVIGFGNSACEIAICLHEHEARPALSVRSPVNVLPRDLFGWPILQIAQLFKFLPPRLVDKMNAPLFRLLLGDLTKLGLRKPDIGPMEQVREYAQIPLLDIGTIDLIRSGDIRVFDDIRHIDGPHVTFADGRTVAFDAIVMATGYRHGLENIIDLSAERLDDISRPITKRRFFGVDSLYVMGTYLSPRGMINELKNEAEQIADHITQATP